MTRALWMAALAALTVGCDRNGGIPRDRVVTTSHQEEMDKAFEKARSELDGFIEALQNPKPGQETFAVKVKIVDGEEVEYFWMGNLAYTDGKFSGTLDNDPKNVTNVKHGDEMTVPRAEIYDWTYMDNGVMQGNHTLRVLFKDMPPDQVEAIKRRFGRD